MKNWGCLLLVFGIALGLFYGFAVLIGGSWKTLAYAAGTWLALLGAVSLLLGFGSLKDSAIMFTTWGFFFTIPAVLVLTGLFKLVGVK